MQRTTTTLNAIALLSMSIACASMPADASAQKLTATGYATHPQSHGQTIYLFQDATSPYMSISSASSNVTWSYAASDSDTPVILKISTTPSDTLNVRAPGLYSISTEGLNESLWWLSPMPQSVSVAIDSMDCYAVYARSAATAPDFSVADTSFHQSITYQWEVADSVILTTRDTVAAIEGLYDPALLTVRAVNQAFNDVTDTISVSPVAVKAAFSFTNRKEDADNEATSTDQTLSAPAEVVFSNNSKGQYTTSEWAMGSVARLYDSNPVYQFQQPGTYSISLTVTNEISGCASTDSSSTISVSDAALEFPNAFTPNGDGVNDVFLPAFRSLKSYELTIYNRWGRRIFTSSDPTSGWDGTENGKKAAAGTYFFIAKAEGYQRGVSFYRKGSITLVR